MKTTMEALTAREELKLSADLVAAGWVCVRAARRRSHGYHGNGCMTQIAYRFTCSLNGVTEYFDLNTKAAAMRAMRDHAANRAADAAADLD